MPVLSVPHCSSARVVGSSQSTCLADDTGGNEYGPDYKQPVDDVQTIEQRQTAAGRSKEIASTGEAEGGAEPLESTFVLMGILVGNCAQE